MASLDQTGTQAAPLSSRWAVLRWFEALPTTLRIPLIVILLMVAVSLVISERVLDRLSRTQESYLQGLATSYLDALASSISPSVLRQDSWEIFDTLERMTPKAVPVEPSETVVTAGDGLVLASDKPQLHPTLQPLPAAFLARFQEPGVNLDTDSGRGYQVRDIDHQGQTIGRVYVVFDASALLGERRQVLLTLIATNALLTAVLALVGFVAVRRMVRPMQVLQNHMEEAAAGHLRPVAPEDFPHHNRDAQRMFASFNALVSAEEERERLERQLAQEERLASLGRLASGMAHEINNPLGGLLTATDTLQKHGERAEVRLQAVALLHRGLLGIHDLVQTALAIYRPERSSRSMTAKDVEDLGLLLAPELQRKHQQLEIESAEPWEEAAYLPAGPLRQAILNLLLNACAASPEAATIGLAIRSTQNGVCVSVEDCGSGLPAALRGMLTSEERLRSPEGFTGLGLWVVRQIADELNARITVQGREPSGTRITLTLPPSRLEATGHAG